jgi:dimethylamine/trimethylamine dehydrogenase
VRDWRVGRLKQMSNVQILPDNALSADDVLAFGAERVAIATGAHWRRDGYGRSGDLPVPGFDRENVYTPDDVLAGRMPAGPVLLYDDDGFYLGSVLAEALRQAGRDVIYVTPDDLVAGWTQNTLDYRHIQKRLRGLEVRIITGHEVSAFHGDTASLACAWTHREITVACASVLTITARMPNDALYLALTARHSEWAAAGIRTVDCIGDALAPGLIAHAVYAGHRYAREFDDTRTHEARVDDVPFLRHLPQAPATGAQ